MSNSGQQRETKYKNDLSVNFEDWCCIAFPAALGMGTRMLICSIKPLQIDIIMLMVTWLIITAMKKKTEIKTVIVNIKKVVHLGSNLQPLIPCIHLN